MSYLTHLPKNTVIMPIGLPGCGKSSFYNYLHKRFQGRVNRISLDDAIYALAARHKCSYDEAYDLMKKDDMAKEFVEEHYDAQWQVARTEGGLIYIDQTNLTRRGRASILNDFKDYHKVGIYFDLTRDEAKKRCHARFLKTGKKIAPHVIDGMASRLAKNMPEVHEFDVLLTIDARKELSRYAGLSTVIKHASVKSPRP